MLCGRVSSVPVLWGAGEEGLDAFDTHFPGCVEPLAVFVEVGEEADGGGVVAGVGDRPVKGVGEKRGRRGRASSDLVYYCFR